MLRMTGLVEQPVETRRPLEREETSVQESCACGGEEFQYREAVLDDGEWVLRCPEWRTPGSPALALRGRPASRAGTGAAEAAPVAEAGGEVMILVRLSEKVLGQRSKREFGRQAEHEIGQKGTSWDSVGLLHGHLRDFSDSLV